MNLAQWPSLQPIQPLAPDLPWLDQSSVPQNPQMMGDGRLGDMKLCNQL
jgi:hypothetical protein